jgi:PmbA protein
VDEGKGGALNTREIAEYLLGLIESSGADEGEVYVRKSEGLELSLRDQAVERLRNKEEGGYAMRLIKDRRMAFVHSSDLRKEALERGVEKGTALAGAVAPDDANVLPEPSQSEVDVETFDPSFDEVTFDRKLGLLKDLETLAFAYDPSISKAEYLGFGDSKTETVIANTKGVFHEGRGTSFRLSVSVVAERDGKVETGGDDSRSVLFDGLDLPSRIASRACWKAMSLLGGATPNTQTVPVIFDRDTGHALLTHLLSMVRGDNVAQGLSALKGRLGEKVGSDALTIVDDATLPHGIRSRSFDAEGVPSRRTVIVDRGSLKSFIFDTRSGLKAGFETTGNATRRSFRDLPEVGNTNLFIEKGESTPEDIIKGTDRGLWLISLAGWWVGINPSTGDFSSGAKGLWVEGGEVAYPVRNVTIASNILDMLGSVDAVGNDLYLKDDISTPTFRIGEMQVGGA